MPKIKRFRFQYRSLSDDKLCSDFMYWIRVARAEGGLKGLERTHFRKLSAEYDRRFKK